MNSQFKQWIYRILYLVLLLSPQVLISQPPEVVSAFESIAKITGASSNDRTTQLLKAEGFEIPDNLKNSWDKFPAYRKIETAYWAAEAAGAGNGEKFIVAISKDLAKEFESVPYESSLKKYILRTKDQFSFAKITNLSLPADISKDIAEPLLSITKYTDAKALGGTHGILKYYFDLNEEDLYKVLRESNNDYDALLKGIKRATIPPSEKERLSRIVKDLKENYLTASLDNKLGQTLNVPDLIREKKGFVLTGKPPAEKMQAEYKTFVDKNHPTEASKKFKAMRVNDRGFGGIILGNTINVSKELGALRQVIWIHEKDADGRDDAGRLEFVFGDNKVKMMHGVLWEDVYAAYNIIYVENKNSNLSEGNGIGLISASYPNVYTEDKTYDSLIRSYNLTQNESDYYQLISKYKKFENSHEKEYNRLNALTVKIKELDQSIDILTKKILKERAENVPYQSDYLKGLRLENERNTLYNEYKPIYDKLVGGETLFITAMRNFTKKDSIAVVHVTEYLSRCNKAVIHPAIANLELGRCLLRDDILPRTGPQMIEKIRSKGATSKQVELCEKWLQGSDSIGWKFSDDVLLISFKGNDLNISRSSLPDSYESQTAFLNFNAIKEGIHGSQSEERPIFSEVAPILINTFYDYYRLNNFTKVMTVLRWAKQSRAVFLNKPTSPPFYKSPLYSKLTKDGQIVLIDRN